MGNDDRQATQPAVDDAAGEQSPHDKLRGTNHTTGSLIPGAQNPESEEIKQEKSPNTE